MLHAYPKQLASFVRSRWGDDAPLPDERELETILSVAYQASQLRDEDRPVTFRLVVAPPDAFPDDAGPPGGLHSLVFATPRAFDEHELRRLSQAAKFHRALIGVHAKASEPFVIWGVVQTGPRWLPSANTGRIYPSNVPDGALVVRVPSAGRIEVAKGNVTIAEMHGGLVTEPGMDVFASRWLPGRFADTREEVVALHRDALDGKEISPVAQDIVRRIGQDVVRRTLAIMREAHHGGTLVLVPPNVVVDGELRVPYLDVKYSFRNGPARRRYRTVMLALLRALAVEGHGAGPLFAEANEAIFELSQLMAALADVDGAVILTRRFEIVGFGAEIVGPLPQVHRVARALDLEAATRSFEGTDGVGTRHRSVYRLVAAMPEALAVVVSQDGTVRVVAHVDGEVTYWDHSATGEAFG